MEYQQLIYEHTWDDLLNLLFKTMEILTVALLFSKNKMLIYSARPK